MANTNPTNNSNNQNTQEPFWAWANSYNPDHPHGSGMGVDHAAAAAAASGFPFNSTPDATSFNSPWGPYAGWGPWGGPFGGGRPQGRGGFGRHGHRHPHHHERAAEHHQRAAEHRQRTTEHDNEMTSDDERTEVFNAEESPETVGGVSYDEKNDRPEDHTPPSSPPPPPFPPGPHRHHRHGHEHGPRGRGRGCGRGGGPGGRGRGGHRGRREGSPPPEFNGPWDFRPLMQALGRHPFAESIRTYMEQVNARATDRQAESGGESFTPPVDTFDTEGAYVLHVALPGCAKEDVGVHWNPDKSTVNIAGVVYRPGDEAFVSGLINGERKIGMFERTIKLPPAGAADKEDIDGFSITAKMENGLLVVTVPKVEKEWTEIRKVDIE